MLKSIHIKDYRSCIDTRFECHPSLTVLIGPNGGGKTNILQGIMLLQRILYQERYHATMEAATVQSRLRATFNFKDSSTILQATVASYTDETNTDVVVGSRCSWRIKAGSNDVIKSKIPLTLGLTRRFPRAWKQRARIYGPSQLYLWGGIDSIRALEKEGPGAIRATSAVANFIDGLKYYGASQFTNPSSCPVSFEIEKEGEKSRAWRIRGHARFLYDLYKSSQKQNDNRYKEFLDIIGGKGLSLIDRIEFQEITTSSIDYSVRSGGKVVERRKDKILIIPKFIKGNHELSPNQLSEGTFKTVVLLFYLMTETSSAMLIEEPEVCIHHGLLSSILELIKGYAKERQIILSTHSDYVLDKVAPENVYQVTIDEKRGTIVRHITKSMSVREFKALKEYLDTVGNLGEYWRSGALED